MTLSVRLREILTRYERGVYVIDTIEISHSLLTQTYRFTREPLGLTATLETASTVTFTGTNFEMEMNGKRDDLDSDFSFTLPDLDNALDDELDLIPFDDTEKILLTYRTFNSDDLSEPSSIFKMSVLGVTQSKGVFTIQCGVPQLNWRQTGEIYTPTRFTPMRAL